VVSTALFGKYILGPFLSNDPAAVACLLQYGKMILFNFYVSSFFALKMRMLWVVLPSFAKHQGFSSLMRTSVSTFKLTHGDLHPNILDRDVVRQPGGRAREGLRRQVCRESVNVYVSVYI